VHRTECSLRKKNLAPFKREGKKRKRKKEPGARARISGAFGAFVCGIEQTRKSIVVPLRIQMIDLFDPIGWIVGRNAKLELVA